MKKIGILLFSLCMLVSCSSEEHNLTVNVKVQGLKKGTLYLQKIEDTMLVNLDSVVVDGQESLNFETSIESPQVLYLYLKKKDANEHNDRILFFAEPGKMVVATTLENFEQDAVVQGSENQKKLQEYQKMMKQFSDRNLDIIQQNLLAQKQQNKTLADSTSRAYDNLIKRRYLYTVNFALNNKEYELAPYLAISEVYNANIKYLDTIYKSLTPEVKESKYGKSLKLFLQERKAAEAAAKEPIAAHSN